MSSRTINRKDFLIVTVSAVTTSVLAAACGGDDTPTPIGTGGTGTAGTATGGTGTAGTNTAGTNTAGTNTGTAGTGTAGTASGGTASGGSGAGGMSGGSGGAGGGSGGASGGSGGASGGTGGTGGGGSCGADIMVMSSGSHKHSLKVTVAQITAGTEVTILSGMELDHAHYVKITAADFTALKAGMEVKKRSCAATDHEYVLKCGGGGAAPGMPTCSDECGNGDSMASACP